jgi:crotonobetainyl-CoA:carnitine CoA-transferase CaiB-like acyl-CoA transferase
VPIGDLLAGMYGAYGVLAALHERASTGRGRVVRTSLLSSVVGVHAYQGTRWTVAHEVPHALGNHHPSIAPYGLFHTADAPIQIACGNQRQWEGLASLLGIDDDRFGSNRERVAHRDAMVALIEQALVSDAAESWLQRLAELGIPAGKVRTLDDVYTWDQTLSQGLLIDVEHPTLGRVQLPGPPLRFDDNSHAGARETHLPPPRLGEHDESVRAWLDSLDD